MSPDPAAECFRCGAPASETLGNAYICEDCVPDSDTVSPSEENGPTKLSDLVCNESETQEGSGAESLAPAGSGDGSQDKEREPEDWAPAIEPGIYPADLVDVDQWLTWKATDDGRKVPRAPYETGGDAFVSAQDPETWTDFATARDYCERLPGFELAFSIRDREAFPGERYVLVDYDDARDPETGAIHPGVREHLDRAGSYADVSTSGTGAHIFCRGALPDGVRAIEASLPAAEGFESAESLAYVLYKKFNTPRYEVDVVLPGGTADIDPLEALSFDDLGIPDEAQPLAIHGQPEITPSGIEVKLGLRGPLQESLGRIAERINQVSKLS